MVGSGGAFLLLGFMLTNLCGRVGPKPARKIFFAEVSLGNLLNRAEEIGVWENPKPNPS